MNETGYIKELWRDTENRDKGRGRWGLDMASSRESNIQSNPQRAQDFNESRDLRFGDSFGNSVGAPFQQFNPSWTHGALKKLCGSSGFRVFQIG